MLHSRRSQVRGLLRRHGFEASPPEWGSIQAACGRNYSCTLNEVFVNPAFERRRAARLRAAGGAGRLYRYGTGVAC